MLGEMLRGEKEKRRKGEKEKCQERVRRRKLGKGESYGKILKEINVTEYNLRMRNENMTEEDKAGETNK